MAMDEATLATELEKLTPVDNEAAAVSALADAYATFAADAVAGTVALSSAGVALGKTAMSAALVGMSVAGAGLVKIPAAVVAFWAAVATGLATSFSGATAIVPPPHATFAADFAQLMVDNKDGNATLAEAAEALAAIMYSGATTSGTATFPGPVTSPIK